VCCTRWGTQTSLPYAREIDEAIKSYNSSRPAKATRDE
jgi:hypothetical protein